MDGGAERQGKASKGKVVVLKVAAADGSLMGG